jgi:hypothetical protein
MNRSREVETERPSDEVRAALVTTARILETAGVGHALVGGVAVQLYLGARRRPTDNVDLALASYRDLPRALFRLSGFVYGRRNARSDTWRAPAAAAARAVTVRFVAGYDDLRAVIPRARPIELAGQPIRVAAPEDLVMLKLAAAEDPYRRLRRRRRDALDVLELLDECPLPRDVIRSIGPRLRRLLKTIPELAQRPPGE